MAQAPMSPLERVLAGSLAPALVNLALIAAIAWIGATLTWQLVPAPQAAAVRQPASVVQAGAAQPRRDLAAEINRHQLFGAATAPAQVEQRVEEAPDTKLNLALRGVLAYDPNASALAIISEGSGAEKVYAIGDELPGAATLEEVFPDRVILRRNGRLETLRLPEDSTPVAVQRDTTQEPLAALSPGELRDRIVKNPMDFARKVRTIPYRQDGQLIGYRLRANEYQDVLAQYGLQPDDVVTEVNGTALNDQKESLRALRSLATAKTISAKILRDGVEMPLFVSLE